MKQNILKVHMLGKFTLTYADRQISCSSNRSKLVWNILAYLLCHRGEIVSKEELISVVWKYEKNDNPEGAMRAAIYRVRTMLSELTGETSTQLLIFKDGGYMWNPEIAVVVDTEEFERLQSFSGVDSDTFDAYLAAIELYEGKFLPTQSSEIWVLPLETYYQNLYEALLERVLPVLEKEGRFEEGISICQKALKIEPYAENIYQYLMRFLLMKDERQEVIRIYEEMSKQLLSTFGIMPDQESRALYREALNSIRNNHEISPEAVQEQLCEPGEIKGALVCDYDFLKMLYQAQARSIVRSGQVIHTVLVTLKNRNKQEVSAKSLSLAMDNPEKHLSSSLRKGDVITRCSSSQFLIMLPSSNYENSCKVCQRFISSFVKKYPHAPVYVDYYVQALVPSTHS